MVAKVGSALLRDVTLWVAMALPAAGYAQANSTTVGDRPGAPPIAGATTTLDLGESRGESDELADVVATSPGAQVRAVGGWGAPSFLTLRAGSPSQTQVFLDGIPLNGGQASTFDLSLIPIDLLGHAEVMRSYVPVQLGASGVGGALALETRFDAREGWRLQATGGSFGSRRIAGARQGGRATRVLVAGAYQGSTGDFSFFDDNGTPLNTDDDATTERLNNHFDEGASLIRVRTRRGRWRLTGLGLTSFRGQGVSGRSGDQAEQASARRRFAMAHLLGQRLATPGQRLDLEVNGGVTWRQEAFEDRLAPAGELGLGRQARDDQVLGASLRVAPTWWLGDDTALRTVGALSGEHYRAEDPLSPPRVDGASRIQLGGGGELAYAHGPWRFDVGGRADVLVSDVSGDPILVEDTEPAIVLGSPHVAMALEEPLSDTVVVWAYLNGSAARRAPDFVELYGDRGTSIGNPALVPEARVGIDGGVGLFMDDGEVVVDLQLGGFGREVDELITYVDNGVGVAVPQNLDAARVGGAELALRVGAPGQAEWFMTADWTRARRLDGGEATYRLPRVPGWAIRGGIAVWPHRVVRLEADVDASGAVYLDDQERREIPSRILYGAGIRWVTPLEGLTVALEGRNLGDSRVATIRVPDGGADREVPRAIGDFEGFPLPGRAFYLTARWRRDDRG